ncbi:MAG: TsoY family (seleno)protein [Pseudomonadota bacterium]
MSRVADSEWTPTYFLAALGAGGLAVSFFMWLLFWLPHAGAPVPLFADALTSLRKGNLLVSMAVVGAWAGIALFSVLHIQLMVWNLRQYARFRRTAAYQQLRKSNSETQLLAGPLTAAMSINVGFYAPNWCSGYWVGSF